MKKLTEEVVVKPFWTSKTFWAVVTGAVAIAAQYFQGVTWLPPAVESIAGLVVVMGLRFITDTGLYIPGIGQKPLQPGIPYTQGDNED